MDRILEKIVEKFGPSNDVVLIIKRGNKTSYIQGRIEDVQENCLIISTSTSIVRIPSDKIIKVSRPKTGVSHDTKPKKDSSNIVKSHVAENVDNTVVSSNKNKKSKTPKEKSLVKMVTKKTSDNLTIDKTIISPNNIGRESEEMLSISMISKGDCHKNWNPKMLIPPMGEIIELEGDTLIIITNDKQRRAVQRTIIIDKKLNKLITEYAVNKKTKLEIPVIWGEFEGEITCLLGVNTFEAVNSRVNTSRDVGNIKVAYSLALLLNAHSTFPAYVRQLESFQKKNGIISKTNSITQHVGPEQITETNFYRQGVLAKEAGEFDRAINLFQQSIKDNEVHKVKAFKELVNTLITLNRHEEAYSLLSESEIINLTSTSVGNNSNKNFSWLSDCLTKIGHDEDVIRINLDRIKDNSITPKQKATCYNRIALAILRSDIDGQEDKAEEYYRKAIEIDSNNKVAQEGLSALRPENFDIESVEEVIDLECSSFAEDKLLAIPEDKRCKQYKDTLIEQLRMLRSVSYSERAGIHLQLASVEKSLGHESDMHRDLAKYLMNCVLEGRRNKSLNSDAAIFMLCESIAHWNISAKFHGRVRRTTHYQDCLALYINLFNRQNPSYFFLSPKLYSAFEYRLYDTPEFYLYISSFLQYRVPFYILMKDLWETNAQSSAINYLNEQGYSFSIEDGKNKFDQGFKIISNRERTNLSELINRLRQMSKSAGYEEMKGRLDEIGEPTLRYELDIQRFLRFRSFFENTLTRYFHNEDITNKYYSQEDSLYAIDSLINEITNQPTRFSYDGLRPVLISIRTLVQNDYKKLSENSKPMIGICQSGDCILQNDELLFQLNITNGRGCLAINNFHVEIAQSDDVVEHIEGMKTIYDSLTGGNDKNLAQRIRISQSAASSETVTINVTLYHGTIGKSEEQNLVKKNLSLHLRNDDVVSINPYSHYAGGHPIENEKDRKMFFGRKDDIKNVAEVMMSNKGGKQIIIYGQSRSGKTSFCNMLAIELKKQGAWCAKFSLLGLYPTSLASFFAFIIDNIVNILYEQEEWVESDFKYAVGNHTTLINNIYQNTPEASISTLYINDLCALQQAIKIKWNKKLILLIDEFTELYTWIGNRLLPNSIMKIWKAVSEDGRLDYSVVLIGQDTTPLFMREPYASNSFQIIEPRRMSYLPVQDAKEMIEQPILDRENKSRFVGKAVDKIIEYTAGSPYYLMIFCNQLVNYMINKKIGKITDVDVDEVAKICIATVLKDKFDNLYAAVEPRPEVKERSKAILKAIAIAMEHHKDGALRTDILEQLSTRYSSEDINKVLTDLEAREVVTVKQDLTDTKLDKFFINIIIFQKWLLEN